MTRPGPDGVLPGSVADMLVQARSNLEPGRTPGSQEKPEEVTVTDLPVHTSQRGLDYHTPIPSEYGGYITVSESSAAEGPHIWVRTRCPVDLNRPDGPTLQTALHLTADNAWQLARQLAATVASHYQGDARAAEHEQHARQTLADVLDNVRVETVDDVLELLAQWGYVLISVGSPLLDCGCPRGEDVDHPAGPGCPTYTGPADAPVELKGRTW